MPQIQVLDNPYQNVMGQATQGIAGLTNAASELEKRRAMQWERIKDLPENRGIGQIAREQFAKDTGLVASPGIIDSIIGYFRDDTSSGLKSLMAPPPAGIQRAGAGVQQAPAAPVREYNPNAVSKQTLEMLGGDAETLSRGRTAPLSNPVASISRDAEGKESYFLNGIPTDKEHFDDNLEDAEAERSQAQSKYDSEVAARNAKIQSVMRRMGKNWDISPDFTAWATTNKMSMAADNIDATRKAYAASKVGAAPQAPAMTLSALAKMNGPEVYDETEADPRSGSAQPFQMQPAGFQGDGRSFGVSSRSSFKGDPSFLHQGSGLSREEMAAIDGIAGEWDSNQRAMATELAFADTIPDPGKRAAAQQYISNKYRAAMAPYDNGVSKPNVAISEGTSARGGNGGYGTGAGGNDLSGYVPTNSGWMQIRRLPEDKGTPTDRALYSMLSTTGANQKETVAAMQKVYTLAEAGDPAAKALVKMAEGDTGAGLLATKIFPSKEARGTIKPEDGAINIKGLNELINSVNKKEIYTGPKTDVDVEGKFFDQTLEPGKPYEASLIKKANKKRSSLSGVVKK